MDVKVQVQGLERLEDLRVAFEAEGHRWDRRIARMRFHNIWQTVITVAWIAIGVMTWAVFK